MNTEFATTKKTHYKRNIIIILILVLIGAGVYGYFWYQGVQKRHAEAQNVIEQAEAYTQLQQAVQAETERCNDFIAGETGNFGAFEYCQRFNVWAENVFAPE